MNLATLPNIKPNRENVNFVNLSDQELAEKIKELKDKQGITYAEISRKTKIHRTDISLFINQGDYKPKVRAALIDVLTLYYGYGETPTDFEYSHTVEIFHTSEFNAVLGFCEDMRIRRKMGVIIGHPGSGKTTAVKEYVDRTDGVIYIEAWPSMRLNDLLSILADSCGVKLKRGSSYLKAQQIIAALKHRGDLMYIIDEAEYLEKWDMEKFETLRKIWDNTQVPIIYAGTHKLKDQLAKGAAGEDLQQLSRRKYKIELFGVKEKEIRELLKRYRLSKQAEDLLVAIAIDVRHGGMGNFTEVLELSLEAAEGEEITGEIVKNAMNYKML